MHNHTSNHKDAIKKDQNCGTFCKTHFTGIKAKTKKKTWRTCSRTKDRDSTTRNTAILDWNSNPGKQNQTPSEAGHYWHNYEICMRTIYLTRHYINGYECDNYMTEFFFLKRYLTKFLEGSVLMSVIYSQMIQQILNCITMRVMTLTWQNHWEPYQKWRGT